ncbi:MAG: tRNA (guanine(10)-N(2))-dimethyltransferase, partial [Candidatus Altiarchaeota archaeon]|nr:tRNA (guanine(10)-N(2))-dimethyltransferase [Candidatus Altiarchaeota archaeon]
MKLKEVVEGESKFLVPDVSLPEDGQVFYNPSQAVSRDLSVLFYKVAGVDVLDGMAASGARSIRLAKNGVNVIANDYDKRAVDLIKKNAKLNRVKFPILNRDFRKAMLDSRYGAVDIDPFGSPVPFIHYALHSATKFIGLAATDTAALCGTYPRVAYRRYGFRSKRMPNYPEIGVRGLAGFVIREAAKLEIAARP